MYSLDIVPLMLWLRPETVLWKVHLSLAECKPDSFDFWEPEAGNIIKKHLRHRDGEIK